MTEIFGVGPIVAAMLIGYSGDPVRFTTASRYAAYTGCAPVEFSSGGRIVHRLSRRGNRRLNHAIHCAAITQIRHRHSPGRGYYERKLAEGKTPREAIRALKRRLSDIVWRHLVADAQRLVSDRLTAGPGGTIQERLCRLRGRLTPAHRLFGAVTTRTLKPRYDHRPDELAGAAGARLDTDRNCHLTTERFSLGAGPWPRWATFGRGIRAFLTDRGHGLGTSG